MSLYELILQTRPLIKFKNASTPDVLFANKTDSVGRWFVSACTFGTLNVNKNRNTKSDPQSKNMWVLTEMAIDPLKASTTPQLHINGLQLGLHREKN